jgi:hypothetical protein
MPITKCIQVVIFQIIFILFGSIFCIVIAQVAEKPQNVTNHDTVNKEKKTYGGWTMTSLNGISKSKLESIQLLSGKSVSALSIQMKDGFYVNVVDPNSSVESAGLEESDVIISFNGRRFKSIDVYEKWIEETLPEQLTLVVFKSSNDYKKSTSIVVAPKNETVEEDDNAQFENNNTREFQRQIRALQRQAIELRKDKQLDLEIALGDTYGKSKAQIKYEKQEIENKYETAEKKRKVMEESLKKQLAAEREHIRNMRNVIGNLEQEQSKDRKNLERELLNERVEKEKEWREKESQSHSKSTESEKPSVETATHDKKSDLLDKEFEVLLQQLEMPKNLEYFSPEIILKQIDAYNEKERDISKIFVLNISPEEKQSLVVYLLLLQKTQGKKYDSIDFKYRLQGLVSGKEKLKKKLDVYTINKIDIDRTVSRAIAVSKSGGGASVDDIRLLESMLPESNRLSGNAYAKEEEERLAKVKREKEKNDLFK